MAPGGFWCACRPMLQSRETQGRPFLTCGGPYSADLLMVANCDPTRTGDDKSRRCIMLFICLPAAHEGGRCRGWNPGRALLRQIMDRCRGALLQYAVRCPSTATINSLSCGQPESVNLWTADALDKVSFTWEGIHARPTYLTYQNVFGECSPTVSSSPL
jgi:hypothetical protein